MVQVVMKNVKRLLSKYIGSDISMLTESGSLNNDLSALMESLSMNNLINGFTVLNVVSKESGHLLLDMKLSTKYMVEGIRSYSGLSSVG
jgi:hypothetical protein